jgi:hypothetical protein
MKVHARFHVQAHTRTSGYGYGGKDVADQFKLYGVKGEPFGSATPNASMDMTILNPEAAKLFIEALETRRNVDVIFSLADPEQE